MNRSLSGYFTGSILLVMVGCTDGSESHNDLPTKIIQAKGFDELSAPIRYIRCHTTAQQARSTIEILVAKVSSSKPCRFSPNWDSDEYFSFVSFDEFVKPHGKRQKDYRPIRERFSTFQDLSIEGGRSAWALERLLGLYLPPMIRSLDPETREKHAMQIQDRVEKAMATRPSVLRHPQLSESDRVKLASIPDQHPWIIHELAYDESPLVRRKVASHKYCFRELFRGKLLEDDDATVYDTAFRRHIRETSLVGPIEKQRYKYIRPYSDLINSTGVIRGSGSD